MCHLPRAFFIALTSFLVTKHTDILLLQIVFLLHSALEPLHFSKRGLTKTHKRLQLIIPDEYTVKKVFLKKEKLFSIERRSSEI
jgi:hypothetical protein